MSNKIINCKCSCNKVMIWGSDAIIVLEGCEHIVHRKCLIDKKKCPICNVEINKYYNERELYKLKNTSYNFYQKYVDLISLKNSSHLSEKNLNKMFTNIPTFVNILSKIMTSKGFDKGKEIAEDLLSILNTKLIVHGEENISKDRKIIIANHTSIIDSAVISYLFSCGFLSSVTILQSTFGTTIINLIPLLLLNRSKKEKTVDRINKYVKDVESLCLFPEGVLTHPDTIIQFRTGAFYAGHPIQPVVIKYDTVVYDVSLDTTLQKLLSLNNLTIQVYILPLEYPPFNTQKIEEIRSKMAKIGNMALSRVSNKDINEDT
jgi:1-acyl-sn-glycerol-3-phosphate acyltransferase